MSAPYFPRQSNTANWTFTHQFCDPNGDPLWAKLATIVTSPPTVPDGEFVTVTMSVLDQCGRQSLQTSTSDGTGQIVARDNGYITVNIPPEKMGLCRGMYDVRMKIVANNFTIEQLYGRLPICEGS